MINIKEVSNMLGKTHAMVGIATAYTLLLPTNNIGLILCGTTVSALGSVLPDIDVSGTNTLAKKELFNAFLLIITYTLLTPVLLKYTGTSFVLPQIQSLGSTLTGLLILSVYSIIGVQSKHREFTHSLEGILLATASVTFIAPVLAKWFALGYTTHIALDLLNRKPIKLLSFVKKKTCLNLCSASGVTDKVIRYGSKVYVAIITYLWIAGLIL